MFRYQVPLTTDFPSAINNSKDEPFICPSAGTLPSSYCPPIIKPTNQLNEPNKTNSDKTVINPCQIGQVSAMYTDLYFLFDTDTYAVY